MLCKYCDKEIVSKRGRGDCVRITCGSKECLIKHTKERSKKTL